MYGYDRSSNRTHRRDEAARSHGKTFDELYEYDRLNQLKKFHRGLLVDEDRVIESPGLQQSWQFDSTGKWKNFTQFDPTDAAKTLDQQRLHNRVNEITEIARTVGANWATPTYDRNGNTLTDEAAKQFVYDAWNRLKIVKNSGGSTLATYSYDATGRRVREGRGGTTTDLYYSSQWQVLEERVSGTATKSYVWSPVYVDAMIARDRDPDSNGSLEERLYAVHDANFNVVALLDTSGNVVERFAYDAFGVFSVLTPAWGARGSSSYAWNYLHQGSRWDADGGLYSRRRREYSPTLGRWIQNDPIGFQAGDINLYRITANNSIIFSDPSGLVTHDKWNGLAGPFPIAGSGGDLSGTIELDADEKAKTPKGPANAFLGVSLVLNDAKKLEKCGNGDKGNRVFVPFAIVTRTINFDLPEHLKQYVGKWGLDYADDDDKTVFNGKPWLDLTTLAGGYTDFAGARGKGADGGGNWLYEVTILVGIASQCDKDWNVFLDSMIDAVVLTLHVQRNPDSKLRGYVSVDVGVGDSGFDTINGGWIKIMNATLGTNAVGKKQF